jgi:sulfate adenylyltransferase subunit 1
MISSSQDILRIATAGSVDDGKSTLIGRLLFDTHNIYADQLAAVQAASLRKGIDLDLSLLTDGLKDEREQGITIDVAYRYFATTKRKFIIADTPGHFQYTRNMITGASASQLSIVLVDARKGLIEQTKRHLFIASLLQIKHAVVCINKMDLVDYDEIVFENICDSIKDFAAKLEVNDIRFIPISALNGDNVVSTSSKMTWYSGTTLLNTLENIYVGSDYNLIDCRMPVQTVIRPQNDSHPDFRGYAGKVASGIFRVGDSILVQPTGVTSSIKEIYRGEVSVAEAFPPMSVCITLTDDIEISRGYTLVKPMNKATEGTSLNTMLCWMDNEALNPLKKYTVFHSTKQTKCLLDEIVYVVDMNTLHRQEDSSTLKTNDIGRVKLKLSEVLCYDSYAKNKTTGSFILVDDATHNTVAAGMII